ncbi:DUF4349 domain-containing protein [candidate division WWE3 bacterium]|nr:DUF4349 domain-containing protein [candidate division WWE3 bacterium]
MNAIEWVKNHKAETALIAIGVWFIGGKLLGSATLYSINTSSSGNYYGASESIFDGVSALGNSKSTYLPVSQTATPQTNTTDRKVVQDSYLSLLVKDVTKTQEQMVAKAELVGGYMVSSTLSYPEESPYAQIVLRVPSKFLKDVVEHYRSLAIKVTNESLYGQDVTDQYIDLQSRIDSMNQTLTRYEEIRQKATEVNQLVEVQREITSLQTQIDSLKGQQKYLDQTALLSKVTVNLSTDELALPYAPTESFRPAVIFKQAVRSMLGTLRDCGEFIIWVVVYSIIWAPVLAAFIWWRRRAKKAQLIANSGQVKK